MYISIAGPVTLEDVNNFGEFHVVMDGDEAAAVAALDGRAGPSQRDNHLWIDIALVRELAGDAAGTEWEARFEAMLAYAATKGWIDEPNDRVEAHIQPPG
ncbi:hypothetical protein [Candidatus Poriferisocius sp.]|uniref:hypothetical protein n=1 Tax=Candidatus Poriferisocius sp. TaxID=3101276 RepID=UPI003B01FD40